MKKKTIIVEWLQLDSNPEPLRSETNTQPFGQTGQFSQMVETGQFSQIATRIIAIQKIPSNIVPIQNNI